MSSVTQAMLLCAGYSTRMRPLTDKIPKPLVPFWNRQILDFSLDYLTNAGITDVAVNVHHGREPFLEALKKIKKPRISAFEEEDILGTAGGIYNMKPFVKDEHFLVMNCDFLTDIDLNQAISFHIEKQSLATMVLVSHPNAQKYGEIGVDSDGRIVDFPYAKRPGEPVQKGMFTGIHIFSQRIFDEMTTGKLFHVNRDVYGPLIKKNAPVFGYATNARWYDLGETDLYKQAQAELLQKPLHWMKKHRP